MRAQVNAGATQDSERERLLGQIKESREWEGRVKPSVEKARVQIISLKSTVKDLDEKNDAMQERYETNLGGTTGVDYYTAGDQANQSIAGAYPVQEAGALPDATQWRHRAGSDTVAPSISARHSGAAERDPLIVVV